jgi:hypothetical protein
MRSFEPLGGLFCGSLCAIWLSGANVAVACENPSLPNLPPEKGRIHSREERLLELDTLRYIHEMQAYVACLQEEHAAVAGDGSLEASLIAGRNNAAVAELDAVTAVYEERVGPIDVQAWEVAQAERRAAAYGQWRSGGGATTSNGRAGAQGAAAGQGGGATQTQMLGGVAALPDGVEQQRISNCGAPPPGVPAACTP